MHTRQHVNHPQKHLRLSKKRLNNSKMSTLRQGAIVTTEDGIKSALMITSPGYKNPDQNVYVSYIPCNIPVAFSAKEALELPYVSDAIAVQPGDGMLDRLRDAIQQSCADAHAFYLDGLLDLDDQLEIQ